jgi:DNA-binding IclR family transcriptional regulator
VTNAPAAAQALRVLRHVAAQAGPVPAAVIARDLGLPRSSTYQLLAVLVAEGFVVHLPEERRYGLGVSAFELGSAYSRQAPLARLARSPLARLVDDLGHNAHLAVLHGREVLYLVEERAPGRPPLVTDVGVRLPAHLTASGRAVLAALTRAQVRALFPDRSAFVDRTGLGPSSPGQLRQVLEQVRARGFAVEDGEVTPGFASVASAVLDHTGHPVAGVAVTFPTDAAPWWPSRPGTEAERLARAVGVCAGQLTHRIGGRSRSPQRAAPAAAVRRPDVRPTPDA